MLKTFDFECLNCEHRFEDMVEGVEGVPDTCPACNSTETFKKVPGTFTQPKTIVVDYPGSKRHKAGYTHIYNRAAEKAGSQVVNPSTLVSPRKP